jgi:hygromycin-B 4-O-kinase
LEHAVDADRSPATNDHEIDVARAEAFLVERFGPGIRHVAGVGHGEWSKAFSFQHDGADSIIRFGAFPEDFAKDHLAARYASDDLPIPAVTEIGEALGRFYAVSQRLFGDDIDALDGARMRATLPSLFAMFDATRQVDLTGSTGYGMWSTDGNAPHPSWREALLDVASDRDRIGGWRERLAQSPTGNVPFKAAYATLESLVDFCPEERHLIDSDLLHYNVLVVGDRISAVFDWGNSLYGDFLYDIAWFAFWAPWYPAWDGIDFAGEAARHFESIGLSVPHFEERLRCYQIHIGLDGQSYSAFTANWDQLEESAQRTLRIARG